MVRCIRGKNVYFMYVGMLVGALYFLNSYMWKSGHGAKARDVFEGSGFEVDKKESNLNIDKKPSILKFDKKSSKLEREAAERHLADRNILGERAPPRFDNKKVPLNKQLLTGKIPKVGYVPGNSTKAEQLFHTVRVICWIPTSPYLFFKRSIYVLQTWGRRCNKFFFFVSKSERDPKNWQMAMGRPGSIFTDLNHKNYSQENLEFVELDTVEKGTYDLTEKIFTCWEHLYNHHLDDADWFIKVDDDTYVIMENLRYFLSQQDKNKLVYFGHKFIAAGRSYHSGGAGYVMSRRTVTHFVTHHRQLCDMKSGVEDLQIGVCFKRLGIEVSDTVDEKDRAYFYPLGPLATLAGAYPTWFKQYDKKTSHHEGIVGFPRLPISFHYVGQHKMLELELFIYYIQVYGGALGEQTEESFAGGIIRPGLFDDVEEAEKRDKLLSAFDQLDKVHMAHLAQEDNDRRYKLKSKKKIQRPIKGAALQRVKNYRDKIILDHDHDDDDDHGGADDGIIPEFRIVDEPKNDIDTDDITTTTTTSDFDDGKVDLQRQLENMKILETDDDKNDGILIDESRIANDRETDDEDTATTTLDDEEYQRELANFKQLVKEQEKDGKATEFTQLDDGLDRING